MDIRHRMDATRLRILRELADRGTVGATALALSMTPSAVSQQLKILGREAGVSLLEPDGRTLRLTDAGRALVLRADDVVAALDRAADEMASYRGSPRGKVRVALFASGAALQRPRVRAALKNAGVAIAANDVDKPASAVPGLLADHDVILTHRDERGAETSFPRVSVQPLMREPIDLVLRPDHPLAEQDGTIGRRELDKRARRVSGRRRSAVGCIGNRRPASRRSSDKRFPRHRRTGGGGPRRGFDAAIRDHASRSVEETGGGSARCTSL